MMQRFYLIQRANAIAPPRHKWHGLRHIAQCIGLIPFTGCRSVARRLYRRALETFSSHEETHSNVEETTSDAGEIYSDREESHSDVEGIYSDREGKHSDAKEITSDAEEITSDREGIYSDRRSTQFAEQVF
jgi:hypothetical protein